MFGTRNGNGTCSLSRIGIETATVAFIVRLCDAASRWLLYCRLLYYYNITIIFVGDHCQTLRHECFRFVSGYERMRYKLRARRWSQPRGGSRCGTYETRNSSKIRNKTGRQIRWTLKIWKCVKATKKKFRATPSSFWMCQFRFFFIEELIYYDKKGIH